jgi:hypothetical protein
VIDTIDVSYYTSPMAMGKRTRERQPGMWVAATDFPTAASHPFYTRLNQLLREHGFDDFAEAQCAMFYAETMGRPSLSPGVYFRLLLIGYFEGIDSERGHRVARGGLLRLARLSRRWSGTGAAGVAEGLHFTHPLDANREVGGGGFVHTAGTALGCLSLGVMTVITPPPGAGALAGIARRSPGWGSRPGGED